MDYHLISLFVVLLLQLLAASSSASLPLSPSINLIGSFDWIGYQSPAISSRCTDMVKRAAAYGSDTLQFIPTFYYQASSDGNIASFCVMDSNYRRCEPVTKERIREFESSMELCFEEAARQGFKTISITPHLDVASTGESWSIRSWRNGVVFDPSSKISGFNYQEVLLDPLARALGRSIDLSSTKINFCLQGEMGATVFRFPKKYKKLLSSIRQEIIDASSSSVSRVESQSSPSISLGLSFNFVMVDGGQSPYNRQSTSETISNAVLPGTGLIFGPLITSFLAPSVGIRTSSDAPAFDSASVVDLLSSLDYIGISAYAPLELNFDRNSLQNSAFNFVQEMSRAVNTDMDALIRRHGIALHYVEFGVGGGEDATGQRPTRDPSEAARKPWAGVFGPYSKSKDPWTLTPSVGDFMRSYYDKVLSWLEQGAGPTYQIMACHLWSLSSWDVLAIYPESTTDEGSYLDPIVAKKVQLHNRNAHTS